ncbi:MAG: glycosyltransferase family 4 protein [Hyphomicrobiaceae bacterium]|nr:glycosyltransferase family 4 protein [Hyphomicrobiaceae bacterium]
MRHIVFYEPCYNNEHPNLWQLRGNYKYPSILGNLKDRARITIMMHTPPPASDPHRRRLERDYGVNFYRIDEPNFPSSDRGQRLVEILLPVLRRLQADVVSNLNGRTITYCYAAAVAAKRQGLRYVMRVGGDDLTTKAHVYEKSGQPFSGTAQYFNLTLTERIAAELADAIIVMTRREQARLSQITHEPEKIKVCYRGVDQTVFRSDKPREGPCRRFLFIGRKSAEKGYDVLEAAARDVWATHPDVTFTFAGTFDAGVEENRRYIGYVNFKDLPKLYAEHDAVIVCSRSEGFPQVLMEAMSMGLPCIMSRHLFEKDFTEGENALFTAINPGDLVGKIGQLADPASDFYPQLSARTLRYAKDSFDEQQLMSRYQSIMLDD